MVAKQSVRQPVPPGNRKPGSFARGSKRSKVKKENLWKRTVLTAMGTDQRKRQAEQTAAASSLNTCANKTSPREKI